MADGDFKDLARKAAFDKILGDKAFNIAKIITNCPQLLQTF